MFLTILSAKNNIKKSPIEMFVIINCVLMIGEDGRAGMAAITLHHDAPVTPEILMAIYRKCEHELPTYARPIFLRFMTEFVVTQTMKNRKVELVTEGFDLNTVTDPLYVIDNKSKSYKPFTVDNSYAVLQSKL